MVYTGFLVILIRICLKNMPNAVLMWSYIPAAEIVQGRRFGSSRFLGGDAAFAKRISAAEFLW